MTDLFDRIASQALGLGLTLRLRTRSRFEPGSEFTGLETPGSELSEAEQATPTTSTAARPVAAEPLTGPVPTASATDAVERMWRAPEPGVPRVRSAVDPTGNIATAEAPSRQNAPPTEQLPQRPMLLPNARREATADTMPAPSPVALRSAEDPPSPKPGISHIGGPIDAPRIALGRHIARTDMPPTGSLVRAAERHAPLRQAPATTPSRHPLSAPAASPADTSTPRPRCSIR